MQVLVRARPLTDQESTASAASVVSIHSATELEVLNADGKRSFQCSFDGVLGPSSSQEDVYNIVNTCTHSVLDGFNSTIFAYGQTGSGKVLID